MDELITAHYSWTEADFIEACVARHRYSLRSPIVGLGRVFLTGVAVLAVAVVTVKQGAELNPRTIVPDLAIPLLFGVGLLYLFYPQNFLNRLWYRHNCRSLPEATRSIEWGFGPADLWSRTELAESVYRWELFQTIVETRRCFLLYQGPHLALWLPDRAFSSPGMLRMFSDLARTKVPNYVVLGECRFPAKPEPIGLDEL
jgi:hypothetical protein